MVLTNAKFLEAHGDGDAAFMVDVDGEGWLIPVDENNAIYTELMRQENEGLITIDGWAS